MGIEQNPIQTGTLSLAKRTEPNEPELFDRPNPNRTELSDWSNRTEPGLYAVGSILLCSGNTQPITVCRVVCSAIYLSWWIGFILVSDRWLVNDKFRNHAVHSCKFCCERVTKLCLLLGGKFKELRLRRVATALCDVDSNEQTQVHGLLSSSRPRGNGTRHEETVHRRRSRF